jgi:hypothetical protein
MRLMITPAGAVPRPPQVIMNRQPLDPSSFELRPLYEYCKRIPSRCSGKTLNRATLWRWVLTGTRGGWKLKTAEIGGGRFTCDAWVCEFIYGKPPGPRSPGGVAPLPPEERSRIAASLAPKHRRSAA